ncbi:MAG: demethoxyubiquinone hydroxylase family protein [Alphaproteobacteria bacterium]
MSAKRPIAAMMPGAPTGPRRREEILRVDHAGELAAVKIYQGQLAVLGERAATARSAEIVRHMAEAESRHKAAFDKLLAENRARPTALEPLWSAAAFVLGAGSALLGEKAAMAATVAVEEVIDEHYAGQVAELKERDPKLAATLEEFRAEEIEHKETGLAHGATGAPAYPLLSGLIKAGCRLAIRIAEKV